MAALSGPTLCACERLSRDGRAWLPRRGVHALPMVFLFRFQKRFWWFSESVIVLVLLFHGKLVCSMIFLAFCFPKCT